FRSLTRCGKLNHIGVRDFVQMTVKFLWRSECRVVLLSYVFSCGLLQLLSFRSISSHNSCRAQLHAIQIRYRQFQPVPSFQAQTRNNLCRQSELIPIAKTYQRSIHDRTSNLKQYYHESENRTIRKSHSIHTPVRRSDPSAPPCMLDTAPLQSPPQRQ